MVALFFGDGTGFVDEREGLFEIGEGESAGDVVVVDDFREGVARLGRRVRDHGAAARRPCRGCRFCWLVRTWRLLQRARLSSAITSNGMRAAGGLSETLRQLRRRTFGFRIDRSRR